MRSPRFEEWFSQWTAQPLKYVEAMWNGYRYTSSQYNVELAWDAWCAGLEHPV